MANVRVGLHNWQTRIVELNFLVIFKLETSTRTRTFAFVRNLIVECFRLVLKYA